MKPKIGIDIDDVLAETAIFVLKEMQIRHNYTLEFENVQYFEWPKIKGFPLDMPKTTELFRDVLGSTERIHELLPLKGAVESIHSLEKNFELHAITARHISTGDATHAWIEKHFGDSFSKRIDFLGLMQTGNKMTKGDACEKYELEAFIEDNIDYAFTIVDKGIPCFLIERPWNKHRVEIHPLLIRVKSWKEAHDGINYLYQL